tara:strand:+ start:608 stop:907 length:300 start_codon:yes stop_codon:yes gene_type:complete
VSSIYYKEHKNDLGSVLAACDKELVGKTLSEGDMEFKVSEGFYKGQIISPQELTDKIKSSENVNLIGNRVVECAVSANLVDADSVIEIQGIKHAQIFTL